MKKIICILAVCVLIVSGVSAEIVPEFSGWKQAETEHFRFVYEAASKEAAEAYARIADEAWNKVAESYALPKDKITVCVVGRTDTVNAYTSAAPLGIEMFTVPFVIPDFTYRDDWIEYVFTHELIHAANMDFENRNNAFATLFGDFFKAFDFNSLPDWEVEGLTTVLETELTDAGRGRSPYFELLYKAHAMEGSMVGYDDIGNDAVPPRGQAYVYGYLMMRSLADRWGLDTLADIERNRGIQGSLADSVLKITGVHAEDLWQDVKIALARKYADEWNIPAGQIITERDASFYNPAIVFDDGTFITLRRIKDDLAVVLVDPSLPSGEDLYDNLTDGKQKHKETILFSGQMPDNYSVTADMNGNVYAALEIKREDRAPGEETVSQIFCWNRETGLRQLTDGPNYLQPSVSRTGNTLVALEQKGLHTRLVQINLETGEAIPLLDDEKYDFALPSVNQSGSKIALIRVGGGRGAVAYLDLADASSGVRDASVLTVVANGSGPIVDPAFPSWTSYGTLTYCSNDRGRLEVYEVTDYGDGTFTSKPVVSDPVGALWAYSTKRGIYYASYASNGYVIKMKPRSEWGNVPDWNGPSAPGEIVHLGDLEENFKDFEPYTNGNKADFTKRDKDAMVNASTIREPVRTLQNERSYLNLPVPLAYMPSLNLMSLPDDDYAFGYGIMFMAMSRQLAGTYSVASVDAMFYPSLMNFTVDAGIRTLIGNTTLDLYAVRLLSPLNDQFTETNLLLTGLSIPFYNRTYPASSLSISSITTAMGGTLRSSESPFAVNADIPYRYILSGSAGIGVKSEKWNASKSSGVVIDSSLVGLADWSNNDRSIYYGAEAYVDVLFGKNETSFTGFSLTGRYLDAPASLTSFSSVLKHGGKAVSCAYPVNLVGRLEKVTGGNLLKLNLYEEAMVAFSRDGAFWIDDTLCTGLELSVPVKNESLAAGITLDYSLTEKDFSFGEFYFTLKMNFIRH